jgi:hypothetical protein
MQEYLLYCFDGHRLERCERFKAANDAEAKEEALRRQGGRAAELWCAGRKVAEFHLAH